ncbi:MAG: metallophosphoesterase family protein [Nanoarchaeota archaeon]
MRYFLIGDVHGNLEALDTVRKDMLTNYGFSFNAKRNGKSKLINLGDSVGYMANPNEVMNIVFRSADENLLGNHDLASVDESLLDEFNPMAAEALKWTRSNLTPQNKKRLLDLVKKRRYAFKENGIVFAHSTPYASEAMNYVENRHDAWSGFFSHEEFEGKIAFVGHIHVPQIYVVYKSNPKRSDIFGRIVEFNSWDQRKVVSRDLSDAKSALVVIPSVGQPRDSCPMTGYAVYDCQNKKVDMVRVPYNVAKTQDKMIAFGFDERLYLRLGVGR